VPRGPFILTDTEAPTVESGVLHVVPGAHHGKPC